MGCTRGPVGSGQKGQERQELCYELSVQACAWGMNPAVLWLLADELDRTGANRIARAAMIGVAVKLAIR